MRTASAVRPALLAVPVFTLLLGFAYPLAVTGLARLIFPWQATGSIVTRGGRAVGSSLLGQPFRGPGFFHGRPSATVGHPCNGANSGGSNLGPTNPRLRGVVAERLDALRRDGVSSPTVPPELVCASGSGLDPHLSPAGAACQVPRVAAARRLPEEDVRRMVEARTEGRTWGILGEARVNVLLLNMDLDRRAGPSRHGEPGRSRP